MKKIFIIIFLSTSFFVQVQGQTREDLLKEIDDLKRQIALEEQKQQKLNPEDIKKARIEIEKSKDSLLKKELYRDLQKRVEYRNQLDYTDGENLCNVSSLSMALSFLGIDKKPNELNNEIIETRKLLIEYKNTETTQKKDSILKEILKYNICDKNNINDCIDTYKKNDGNFGRGYSRTRGQVAKHYGVDYQLQENKNGKLSDIIPISKITSDIEKNLDEGKAVVMSVGGHLVKIVDVEKDKDGKTKFIVDDPYGSKMDFNQRKSYLETKIPCIENTWV